MKKSRQRMNSCLSHVEGKRCDKPRPLGDLFCQDHKEVCTRCRHSYKVNGLYCEYCSTQIIFDSLE